MPLADFATSSLGPSLPTAGPDVGEVTREVVGEVRPESAQEGLMGIGGPPFPVLGAQPLGESLVRPSEHGSPEMPCVHVCEETCACVSACTRVRVCYVNAHTCLASRALQALCFCIAASQ